MHAQSLRSIHKSTWDRAGMLASLLCVAHCILTPLLAVSLPVLAATEEQTHQSFAVTILLVGMLAFVPGYRKHRRINAVVLGAAGIAMIGIAAFLAEGFLAAEIAPMSTEVALTVAGGMCLIVAHARNAVLCRSCPVCREESCHS